MRFLKRGAQRPRELALGRIAIYGRIRGPALILASSDLAAMPAEQRTPDVAAFAHDESGSAVRFRAIVDAAQPLPGTLYVNFEDRAGERRLAHFGSEIADLAWIAYATESGDAVVERSGSFRLILPGIHGERGRMNDVAWIEFADEPVE